MVALARVSHPPIEQPDADFAAEILAGLTATPKRIAAKYFYDETGSQLFERITELPEYYPTRCEMKILREQ
ncbi:MAG: L-histidine N(alpha)-methyltransferase, partial [Pseudolabrys sp.]|nr:L-histidine N(alpha)-methyltransferase [Pseudolabrys sp.]